MSSTDLAVPERQGSVPLSVLLFRLANDTSRERISVGDLLAALGDRAIGALMFFFAAPNILPVPPGVSTLLGAPLLFLSAQLMLGMRPWLPGIVTRRSLSRDDLATLVRRIVPWLAKAEKLLRPRVSVLVRPPVEYFVGLVCLVLAAVLMLPIPLGNTLPALAISLLALGVLERDGVWIAIGLFASVVAGAVVWGVLWAMVKAVVLILGNFFDF
ncbi:exopolysaccharide biosynthesis protein [Hydrogenophaga sp.]|uniref:exopolysaccharide biosynthesis protein n=1 Tax=Hydrogenophaga sp. TaxID=1904254 RepID=UPI00272F27F2|nr:exopolysaccharide biosynthesis protein [Hydrogenophaga sp.]MDP1686701.1 exopolysaccharide biosynthesis protein [Hydrogenophaga sp.]